MEKIRIGVLCPSEIAYRRFMPALALCDCFEYVGIAAGTYKDFGIKNEDIAIDSELEKANKFKESYGGNVFVGYESILKSNSIDAIYIPLPPGLHFKWASLALLCGKHVLVEKPSTSTYEDSIELVKNAKGKKMALHENYMFNFHNQIDYIESIIKRGEIGEVRLFNISFGFPYRGKQDFRYMKALGGGALLDCGGYTLKLADRLLGGKATITSSSLVSKEGFEVDIFGSAMLTNQEGVPAFVSFGMDNDYKCSLEVWGSQGTIYTNRILTAPVGFNPTVVISKNGVSEESILQSDDTFFKSLMYFYKCICDDTVRNESYQQITRQAELVKCFLEANHGSNN